MVPTFPQKFPYYDVSLNYNQLHNQSLVKKGKAVPLQAWTGPEGSRKLRFPDYMTTAQNGGKFVSLMH